jgi:hypothetical protein
MQLEKHPRYRHLGFASAHYGWGFFLDSAVAVGLGYAGGWLYITQTTPESPLVLQTTLFAIGQLIGHGVLWFWLKKTLRIFRVRRFWVHLVLHLWFASLLQAGMFWPYAMRCSDGLVAGDFGAFAWFCWAFCAPLLVKSLGLWCTIQEALEPLLPTVTGQLRHTAKERFYFRGNSSRKVLDALNSGDASTLAQLRRSAPGLFASYTVLTLYSHGGEAVLHLKDVFLGGWPFFHRGELRAVGFPRLHRVCLMQEEAERIRGLLPQG